MGSYYRYTRILRALLPASRVLVRIGGVYFKKEYLESEAFKRERGSHRRRLTGADMIISTADGTPVDLYMAKVGITPDRYRKWLNGFPAIANDGNRKRRNRIVCISRLHRGKLVDYVIRSFALALPRLTEPHTLAIVGDGPERGNLVALVQQLGLDAHVEFIGYSFDVGQYLYSSKLLLNGITNNPLMEAIASGTPVITPEFGEVQTLYGQLRNVHVVHGPGVGFGPGPAADMDTVIRSTSDKIVEVLNNYPSLDGANRPATDQLYSWEQRLQDELDLCDDLFAPVPKADAVPVATGLP
jgi:glycosyltransferase involved in cell wall biosynthesis